MASLCDGPASPQARGVALAPALGPCPGHQPSGGISEGASRLYTETFLWLHSACPLCPAPSYLKLNCKKKELVSPSVKQLHPSPRLPPSVQTTCALGGVRAGHAWCRQEGRILGWPRGWLPLSSLKLPPASSWQGASFSFPSSFGIIVCEGKKKIPDPRCLAEAGGSGERMHAPTSCAPPTPISVC